MVIAVILIYITD